MSLDTYSNLKTEIEEHLDRDDLTSKIDTFIDLAEARHKREVRIRDMIARSQSDASARYLTLPSGFLQMITLRLLTDPVTVLDEVNLHEMNRFRTEGTGKPLKYTVHEEIEFDISPDSTYTAEMIYYKELDPLSDSNVSNAILSRAPDLYLYGALLAAEPYIREDERIPMWADLYKSALDAINKQDQKRAGPLVSKVVGATP